MENNVLVETVKIKDNEYVIIDEISDDKTSYLYLSNINDNKDFFVQKLDSTKENIINLENENEFIKAMKLYFNKYLAA